MRPAGFNDQCNALLASFAAEVKRAGGPDIDPVACDLEEIIELILDPQSIPPEAVDRLLAQATPLARFIADPNTSPEPTPLIEGYVAALDAMERRRNEQN